MTLRHEAGAALDPGLLVRHIHGELAREESEALAAHLADCETCRTASTSLERRMRDASGALRLGDFDPPAPAEWQVVLESIRSHTTTRRRAVRYRMAAGWIFVAVAVGGLSSAPVRAWLVDRWTTLTGSPTTAPIDGDASAGSASIAFVPAGPDLTLILRELQADGLLFIRFLSGDTARVRISGGGAESLAWGGTTISIANDNASAASYSIDVPSAIARLSIVIAGRDPLTIDRTATDDGQTTIALSTGRPVRNETARDEH